MMNEVWLPIKGYEGSYEVSNLGRVRSLDRVIFYNKDTKAQSRSRLSKGRILAFALDSSGYPHIGLCKDFQTKKTFKVHRLVAAAFILNPGDKPCVNHLDGCKTNSVVSNLEWVTSKENHDHAIAIGLKKNPAVDNGKLKLTAENVRQAKELRSLGYSLESIGRTIGVSGAYAGRLLAGKSEYWKHLI
jgi:NUMOD4 motif